MATATPTTSVAAKPAAPPDAADIIHPVYDAAMPKGPLIEDRHKRQAAVALLMALLLAGLLGMTWLITGAAIF